MLRLLILLFALAPATAHALCATPPCVLVASSSNATGFPQSEVDGQSLHRKIGQPSYPWVFANLIGATVGGTAGTGASYPNDCTDGTGVAPHSTCPIDPFPACLAQQPVCDVGCAGSLMNIPLFNCMPMCNVSGGTCQAGSQIANIVAEIGAAGANEIAAVIWAPTFVDRILVCLDLDAGSTTAWDNWKAGYTAALSDLRTAINASLSPNAQIIAIGRFRQYLIDPDDPDVYWNYNASNLLNCLDGSPESPYGGETSEYVAYVRAEAATYGAIFIEGIDTKMDRYWRWSERTFQTTAPADCGVGGCDGEHANNWGHKWIGEEVWRQYLIATGATDTDSDGAPDVYETHIGTNPAVADTDGDGCIDGLEVGGSAYFGGRRDPNNAFDFMDLNGDKVIDEQDRLLMTQRAILGMPSRSYSSTFQRLPPLDYVIGGDPEDKYPHSTREVAANQPYPNSYPTIQDLMLLELQMTHSCDPACQADYGSGCFLALGAECTEDAQCLSGVCGCNGAALRSRKCLASDTMTGGYATDPRSCPGSLGQGRRCKVNGDCASGVCKEAVVQNIFQCVGN